MSRGAAAAAVLASCLVSPPPLPAFHPHLTASRHATISTRYFAAKDEATEEAAPAEAEAEADVEKAEEEPAAE